MHARKYHIPSAGVLGLVVGGILRIMATSLQWPDGLVLLSNLVLWMSTIWVLVFDFFPIFLYPFYVMTKRFQRRFSFMVVLFLLFVLFQGISFFLPSSERRDMAVLLALLSFMASMLWGIFLLMANKLKPALRYFQRRRYVSEQLTLADILTSLAIIIIPSTVLSFSFVAPGLSATETTPYQSFITSLLTNVFMAAYLFLFVIRPKVFSWRQLGIKRVDRENWGRALVLFVAVSVLIYIFNALLARLGLSLQQYSFDNRDGLVLAVFMAVVVTPFVEELYFRGFLFRGLLLHHKPWVAYLVSAFVFALFHPPLIVMVDVFFIGLVLAYVVHKTKSIWPGVLIHALNNAIVLAYLLARP